MSAAFLSRFITNVFISAPGTSDPAVFRPGGPHALVSGLCKFDFDRALTSLSTRLGDRAYVMGDPFTVPDLLFGHLATWATNTHWDIPAGNVPDYIPRIPARPAYLQTVELRAATETAATQ